MFKEIREELICVVSSIHEGNNKAAYDNLISVIPKMDEAVNYINNEEIEGLLTDKLRKVLDAMEKNELLLLADIIQNELIVIIEGL